MIEWSEQQLQIRSMIRRFVDTEVKPRIVDVEHEGVPPYDVLRKMIKTFGLDAMARGRFASQIAREKARAAGDTTADDKPKKPKDPEEAAMEMAMRMLPIIELCRYSPGMVTALGVSMGLTANAIMSKGTIAQKERWVLDLLTLDKVGAWAITEPGSGSDAFGSMKSTARRDGDGYVLNGSKTFITNGPYADTIVFICKLDEGNPPAERKVVTFVLDKGTPGLTQSKPLRKMGLHGSPTGELFLEDVRVGRDRLLGETEESAGGRSGAKDTFTADRSVVGGFGIVFV
jgi:alkylation response protein AidB-like acyl-CoA dehydrogenase